MSQFVSPTIRLGGVRGLHLERRLRHLQVLLQELALNFTSVVAISGSFLLHPLVPSRSLERRRFVGVHCLELFHLARQQVDEVLQGVLAWTRLLAVGVPEGRILLLVGV